MEFTERTIHNYTIDLRAFDGALASVLMRDEDSDGVATTFTLNYATAALAGTEGGLVLRHSVTEAPAVTPNANVNVRLADASGANNTVVLRVENDLNKETVFNYKLDFDGASSATDTTLAGGKVENVTIVDADTESNTVELVKTTEHTVVYRSFCKFHFAGCLLGGDLRRYAPTLPAQQTARGWV
ncbi:hypothetical protein [Tepidimonas thermarum]|nr:hypothetical protein [Tepidimonas thermarum]